MNDYVTIVKDKVVKKVEKRLLDNYIKAGWTALGETKSSIKEYTPFYSKK